MEWPMAVLLVQTFRWEKTPQKPGDTGICSFAGLPESKAVNEALTSMVTIVNHLTADIRSRVPFLKAII